MALTGRRIPIVLATLAAAVAAGASSPAAPHAAPITAAKACSAGFKHAVIGGQQKCLRAGEFCTHRYDNQYRRYGYRCIKYDPRVARYRLTHS